MADGYGIDHLPYGVFRPADGEPRVGARLGEGVVDVRRVADAPEGTLDGPSLNRFLKAGATVWASVRRQLQAAVREGNHQESFHPLADVELLCPLDPPDYVDFYSSLEHATNLGRILRPGAEPLLPNWRHLPVGYHGRSGSVVGSGSPVRRPAGQRRPASAGALPDFGPSQQLDFELELGFVTGDGPAPGTPVPIGEWRERVFGVCLVNDWSARDLQRWEYQPLGPFLSKSFATSVSHWITPLAALEPFEAEPRPQDPEPLEYLRGGEPAAFDIELEVALRARGGAETIVSRTNARGLYWTVAQQLAHATVNGSALRAGDLFASGTISGAEPGSYGSLVELSWGGSQPVPLDGGDSRCFLEDGDTVTLRGRCAARGAGLALGEVTGTVVPAQA